MGSPGFLMASPDTGRNGANILEEPLGAHQNADAIGGDASTREWKREYGI